MKYNFDCVVVGAGISGMTAAIYLKRSNVNVLVLESGAPGGLLHKVTTIENYPGFKKITGPDLASLLYEQVNELGIEIRYGKVLDINNHIIKTDIEELSSEKIVIATGRNAKRLDDAEDLKNVSYCALCDGNLYKDKTVALIGNGNSALEEVLYLSDLCEKVIMLDRSDRLKGEEILIDKVLNKKNVEVKYNCVINTLNKEENVLTSIDTNLGDFSVDGAFICIGYEPSIDFLKDIKMDNKYIIVDDKMKTSVDYIYACGDIIKKDVYQLTTAASDATIAAVNIKKDLNKK